MMRTLATSTASTASASTRCIRRTSTPACDERSDLPLFRPDLENPTAEEFEPASRTMHLLPIPWVEAQDVSNAVLFLASDEGRYITGVALPIDGGTAVKS
jgi:(+)-trans-carveol dehydrogenase